MPSGWMGTNLEVDLTRGSIERIKGDPELVRTYLGGKGTNAKILWDRVPPETDPFSPDNLIIVGTGILCGTPVPGANRTVITYRSPMTNAHSWSAMGGFFAPELKHAGYDTIIFSGKSPTPVYLWIKDDHVELRGASRFWGKGTHETQDFIRQELEDDKLQIICIGPAGENRAYAASVEHSTGASAARGGVGAIWGDKNLKAIAVYGTKDVNLANPAKLIELSQQVLDRTDEKMKRAKVWPAAVAGSLIGSVLPGNFETRATIPSELKRKWSSEDALAKSKEVLGGRKLRDVACYNCSLACKWTFPAEGGGFSSYKCNSLPNIMGVTKIIDFNFALKFYQLVEEYGFDSVSVSTQIGLAIDLYEKGILTKEDTDGMHLEFGNPEVAYVLAGKIARREGIGDVLADGVYRAAQRIGRGAEKYAHHARKQDAMPYDFRKRPDWMLYTAVSDKGDLSRLEGTRLHTIQALSKQEREEYIKKGWFTYPKEYEKYLVEDDDETGTNYEAMCQLTSYGDEVYTLNDMVGICYFWSLFWGYSAFGDRVQLADLVSSATGMDFDEAELTEIAQRTIHLIRADIARVGVRRKDDILEDMFFDKPDGDHPHQYDKALFNKWLDRYYEIKGWNSEGIPTRETLEKLGMDDVRQDLEQREILKGKEALTA